MATSQGSQVNFPVPDNIGSEWRKLCDQYGIGYGEDLAGLLYAASFFPKTAHHLFKAMAMAEYPPTVQKAVVDLMEQVRTGMAAIFGESPESRAGRRR